MKDFLSLGGLLILGRGVVVVVGVKKKISFFSSNLKLLICCARNQRSLCVFVCSLQEEVKRLRVHVEEVIKENERLHDEIAKIGGVSQKDW